jgi:transcriptional regulator with XRE-family HTH domain
MRNITGRKIREARKKLKPPLTQEKLAARLEANGLKISRDMIAKIEIGEREVNDIELLALAKALKIPVEALFEK